MCDMIVSHDQGFRFVKNLFRCIVQLRQVRQLCFAWTYSNPLGKLDDHPFILGLPAVRMNGVPFSLVLSGRRVANHVLVFLIHALSKFRFVSGFFFCIILPLWCFYITFLYIFLVCSTAVYVN